MKGLNWALVGLGCALLPLGCADEPAALGDQTIVLWEQTPIAFEPDNATPELNGWLRLDAGRTLLKPLILPKYARRTDITLHLTLQSHGDPWDKVGSVFALADGDGRRFMERLREGVQSDTTRFAGVMAEPDGTPPLEWMRFITPFGAGHFSDHPKADAWRPVYIPKWENAVHWEAQLDDFQPWLAAADTVWIGLHIDTWTAEGYVVDGRLEFRESDLACDVAPQHTILPLWNTMKLTHDQRPYTGFPDGPLLTEVRTREGQVTCGLITTGHGGHEGGDEFTPQPHALSVDGAVAHAWTPWRDDCASFRRFNPTSGSWLVEERGRSEEVASSDLSRSNWCPGSHVAPLMIPLGRWEEPLHAVALAIPGAQRLGPDAHNFWNVSAYLKIEDAGQM